MPYRNGLYRLYSARRTEKGLVWQRQRQQRLNGIPRGRRVGYTVQINNLTRFSDIGKLAAFFKGEDFDRVRNKRLTHNPPFQGRRLSGG